MVIRGTDGVALFLRPRHLVYIAQTDKTIQSFGHFDQISAYMYYRARCYVILERPPGLYASCRFFQCKGHNILADRFIFCMLLVIPN